MNAINNVCGCYRVSSHRCLRRYVCIYMYTMYVHLCIASRSGYIAWSLTHHAILRSLCPHQPRSPPIHPPSVDAATTASCVTDSIAVCDSNFLVIIVNTVDEQSCRNVHMTMPPHPCLSHLVPNTWEWQLLRTRCERQGCDGMVM